MALQHLHLVDAPVGADDRLEHDDGGYAGLAGNVRVLRLDALDLLGRLDLAADAHGPLRRLGGLFFHDAAFDAAQLAADHATLHAADHATLDAADLAADHSALFAAGYAFRHAADNAAHLADVDGFFPGYLLGNFDRRRELRLLLHDGLGLLDLRLDFRLHRLRFRSRGRRRRRRRRRRRWRRRVHEERLHRV